MSFVILLLLGFSISYVGTIAPGMLNLTTTKIRLDHDKSSALKFAAGVSIIVFVQTYVALLLTGYIHSSVALSKSISIAGIVIFLALSIYFLIQAKKEAKTTLSPLRNKNYLRYGMLLATLNMFSIPYYCAVGSALSSGGLLKLINSNIIFFAIGSSLGTFALLYTYTSSANLIDKKVNFISRNTNYVLSFITLSVAIITIFNIL